MPSHHSPTDEDEDARAQVGMPAPAAAATTQDAAPGSGWRYGNLPLQASSFPSGSLAAVHPLDVFTLLKTLAYLHDLPEVASQGGRSPSPAHSWMILEGGGKERRHLHPSTQHPPGTPSPHGNVQRYFKDAETSQDSRLDRAFQHNGIAGTCLFCFQEKQGQRPTPKWRHAGSTRKRGLRWVGGALGGKVGSLGKQVGSGESRWGFRCRHTPPHLSQLENKLADTVPASSPSAPAVS